MPNKNYQKGRRKEYALKRKLESEGWLVLRSAGSHGFADLVAISETKVIFIQCKPDNFSDLDKSRLLEKYKFINSYRECFFEVI